MPNEARRVYDAASAEKRLGSRISRAQFTAVEKAVEEVPPMSADLAHLAAYAETGDRDHLTDDEYRAIAILVEAAKAHLETPSMKRRLWPRKVAAIVSL